MIILDILFTIVLLALITVCTWATVALLRDVYTLGDEVDVVFLVLMFTISLLLLAIISLPVSYLIYGESYIIVPRTEVAVMEVADGYIFQVMKEDPTKCHTSYKKVQLATSIVDINKGECNMWVIYTRVWNPFIWGVEDRYSGYKLFNYHGKELK